MVKKYDKEFKIEAVQLASEPGNTQAQVQRELGIGQGLHMMCKIQEIEFTGHRLILSCFTPHWFTT